MVRKNRVCIRMTQKLLDRLLLWKGKMVPLQLSNHCNRSKHIGSDLSCLFIEMFSIVIVHRECSKHLSCLSVKFQNESLKLYVNTVSVDIQYSRLRTQQDTWSNWLTDAKMYSSISLEVRSGRIEYSWFSNDLIGLL